jgi:betaine-homocysteine S-methyltransferase
MKNNRELLDRLESGIMLVAEGYIFELERRGYIKAGPFVPEVVLDCPEAVIQLHREYMRAGSEVMVALTYYAHREKLKTVGREDDLEAMNRQAVRLARKVAQEGDALTAGNICNTWAYDPDDHEQSKKVVGTMYREQLQWAVEEGIDLVIAETNDYLGEALIALEVIKELNLPAIVTLATVQPDKTRDGYAYDEACKILEDNGADVVGLNCSRGPTTMLPILEKIRDKVTGYVAALPVPYRTTDTAPTMEKLKRHDDLPAFPIALEPFLLTRFEIAEFARIAQRMGINYIGVCCGGAPHHVRAMAEALDKTVPAGKYSPAMDLHPMLGDSVQKKDQKHIADWKT